VVLLVILFVVFLVVLLLFLVVLLLVFLVVLLVLVVLLRVGLLQLLVLVVLVALLRDGRGLAGAGLGADLVHRGAQGERPAHHDGVALGGGQGGGDRLLEVRPVVQERSQGRQRALVEAVAAGHLAAVVQVGPAVDDVAQGLVHDRVQRRALHGAGRGLGV